MPTDYIPPDDAGKFIWLANFDGWLTANGATHGFSAGEITAFTTATGLFGTDYTASEAAQAAARAAIQTKNTSRAAAIALARSYAQRLQSHPATTNADRAAAGITVPGSSPAPSPSELSSIPPPILVLDFSQRRQVTIHWGPNPADEAHNGRPAGTLGSQVQFARGGIPTDEASWSALEIDTDSPLLHIVDESTPITFAYRARYVGRNLKFGPLGDPVVCTVSV